MVGLIHGSEMGPFSLSVGLNRFRCLSSCLVIYLDQRFMLNLSDVVNPSLLVWKQSPKLFGHQHLQSIFRISHFQDHFSGRLIFNYVCLDHPEQLYSEISNFVVRFGKKK